MVHDPEVEAAYPRQWIGKVEVRTTDGRVLRACVPEPKGDPGNTLSRREVEDKALRLAQFSGAATPEEMDALARMAFALADAPVVGTLLPDGGSLDAHTRQGPVHPARLDEPSTVNS